MKIKKLFTKFDVPIIFRDLKNSGEYWFKSDCIVLDHEMKKSFPAYVKIVFLHEMMHSTLNKKRLNRIERLVNNFGEYNDGTLAYRMEECIAEVGCMVACLKLGLFNEYSKNIILQGIEKCYTPDMYLPVREIRAAVKYFADDETSFEEEIEEAKLYLDSYLDVKFQDSYTKKAAS